MGEVFELIIDDLLFDGRGEKFIGAAAQAARQAEYAVGGQALADVHLFLDRQIKHPTPYYETQIRLERVSDGVSVNDRGVIYGPWLEGTSSRNQTTRFKGYASFRKGMQKTRTAVDRIAQPIFDRLLTEGE